MAEAERTVTILRLARGKLGATCALFFAQGVTSGLLVMDSIDLRTLNRQPPYSNRSIRHRHQCTVL